MHLNGNEDKTFTSLKIWEGIYDSYIKYIGLGEEYEMLLKHKLKLHQLMCDRITTGNNFITNYIAIEEANIQRLEDALKGSDESTNEDTINILEENRKIAIDPFRMSVAKYYSLIKYYTEKSKREVSQSKRAA